MGEIAGVSGEQAQGDQSDKYRRDGDGKTVQNNAASAEESASAAEELSGQARSLGDGEWGSVVFGKEGKGVFHNQRGEETYTS